MEALDLVHIGADGSPHWSRVWPTPEENPRHAGLDDHVRGSANLECYLVEAGVDSGEGLFVQPRVSTL
jgi:hypothetical protein